MDETLIRQIVHEELQIFFGSEKTIFQKHLQIMNGRNIQVGRGTGTKIGTEAAQKIGFFGTTPKIQQTAISNPVGGGTGVTDAIDVQARAAIVTIINVLKNLGLTA